MIGGNLHSNADNYDGKHSSSINNIYSFNNNIHSAFRSVLLFLVVFLYFINLPLYLSSYDIAAGFVHHILLGLFGLYLIILLIICDARIYRHNFIYFCLFMITFIPVINVFYVHDSDFKALLSVDIYRYVAAILIFVYIYNFDERIIVTRYAILFASLVTVMLNLYTLFNPFSLLQDEYVIIGRASGLFLNPNQAGMVLGLSAALCFSLIPIKYRPLYLLFLLVGVVTTFSRSSIIGYILILITLIYYRQVNLIYFVLWLMALFIIFLFFIIYIFGGWYIFDTLAENSNVITRLLWFESGGSVGNFSSRERMRVILKSIEILEFHPFTGIGISGMQDWDVKTHNMYLYYIVQYGLFGVMIYPLFILSVYSRKLVQYIHIYIPLSISLLFYGLFSHNMMEEYYVLISCAAIAALGAQSHMHKR